MLVMPSRSSILLMENVFKHGDCWAHYFPVFIVIVIDGHCDSALPHFRELKFHVQM